MLGMNSAWTRRSTPVRAYEAPVGSVAAGAAFKDAWILDDVEPFESLVAWCDAGRGYRPGRHLARYRTQPAPRLYFLRAGRVSIGTMPDGGLC